MDNTFMFSSEIKAILEHPDFVKEVNAEALKPYLTFQFSALNETFFNFHHKFHLGGFKIYREDRSTHGGGVLIAIKSNIKHSLLPRIKTKTAENISIQVMINSRPVIFTSAYNPVYSPNFHASQFRKRTTL